MARAAAYGLTTILLVATIFALAAAGMTERAAGEVNAADMLNRLWNTARFDVASQESLERKYRLEPSPAVRLAHADAGLSLARTLDAIRQAGDATDGSLARAVLEDYGAYQRGTNELFDAVDRRLPKLVLQVDRRTDPVFESIQQRVEARAERERSIAEQKMTDLHVLRQRLSWTAIGLSLLASLFLVATLLIVRAYRRRLLAEHDAKIRQLEDVALIDNLTRLGNHRAFSEDLERRIAEATRDGSELTLAIVDVDDLKVLNDQRGHLHGDEILASLGTLLRDVGGDVRAYRIGGDEFAAIFERTSQAAAGDIMERVRADAAISLRGATISIGIATLRDEVHGPETLHARADAALYATKQHGRDGVTAYDDADKRLSVVSPARIGSWRALIEEREVTVAYQPIWDVDSQSVVAYEALARPAQKYGFNEPRQAFDFAERIGRAFELDEVCLGVALSSARAMPPDALLFLNVSPQSLHHHHFDPVAFTANVRTSGHRPERVVIEITERAILQVSGVIETVNRLRSAGFRIALDDTGAGNAGLELLSRLPLDFVKIDGDVVVDAVTERSARGVVAGIVAIAEATGAYVIAEGIESADIFKLVCDFNRGRPEGGRIRGLQGFALGRPLATFLAPGDAAPFGRLAADATERRDAPVAL